MKTWWTTREAAVHGHCSAKTIRRAVKLGHLRHVRLAGNFRLRFKPAWVEDWLLANQPDAQSGVLCDGRTRKPAGNANGTAGSVPGPAPM